MKNILLSICMIVILSTQVKAQNWNTDYFPPVGYFVPCDSELIFYSEDSSNIWQSGTSSAKSFFGLNGNEPAIMTDSVNSYPTSNHSYFDILLPDYGACPNVEIRFLHKLESDDAKDGGYITCSVDGGATWHSVFELNYLGFNMSGFQNLYFPEDSFESSEGFAGFNGLIDEYLETRIEFVRYMPVRLADVQKMQELDLVVRFNFVSDSVQTNKAGWVIRNLQVWGLDLGSSVPPVDASDHQVTVSAQPMGDLLFQTGEGNPFQSLNIYSVNGQLVYHAAKINSSMLTVPFAQASAGLYCYSILFTNGEVVNGKLER